jgi:two-component system CheB/CheR fusion protein
MLRADGSRYWSAGRTIALRDRDGNLQGYLKIFRDQTELKMRIAALRNRASLLDADQRARTRLLAGMARQLQEQLASSPNAAGEAAMRLAQDIAQVAQAEETALELQLEALRMDEEIAATVELATQSARHAPVVEVLLPPGQPIVLQADRRRLRQALAELLDNAIRSTSGDGRIWVNASVENAQALVRIEDNGAGMDRDTQAAVYALLTDPNAPSDTVGLRSGLALARFLVELHGGTIQARSAGPGKGSEFSVRLPLSQASRVVPAPL